MRRRDLLTSSQLKGVIKRKNGFVGPCPGFGGGAKRQREAKREAKRQRQLASLIQQREEEDTEVGGQ